MAFVLQSEWSSDGSAPSAYRGSGTAAKGRSDMAGRLGSIAFTVLVHIMLLLILFTQLFSGKVAPSVGRRETASLINVDLIGPAESPPTQSPVEPQQDPLTQDKQMDSQPKVTPEWTTTTIVVPQAPPQPAIAKVASIAPTSPSPTGTTSMAGMNGGGRAYDPYAGASVIPFQFPGAGAASERLSRAEPQPPTVMAPAQSARAAAMAGINDAIGKLARARPRLRGTVQLRLCIAGGSRFDLIEVLGGTIGRAELAMLALDLRQRFGSSHPSGCEIETATFPVPPS